MTDQNQNVMQFEIVKRVTVPFLRIDDAGTPSYLKFDTAILPDTTTFSERVRASKNDATSKQEPIHIATVTNVQTGEVLRLVAHQVLESTLDDAYPDKSYVGRIFEIKKSKREGKRYFSFDIQEIKLKGANSSAPVAGKK
jgi:hypothetical protein